jgi:hypothetical protein
VGGEGFSFIHSFVCSLSETEMLVNCEPSLSLTNEQGFKLSMDKKELCAEAQVQQGGAGYGVSRQDETAKWGFRIRVCVSPVTQSVPQSKCNLCFQGCD